MEFQEKYTNTTDKALPLNTDKKIIGDDAFALGEVISKLTKEIIKLRLSK